MSYSQRYSLNLVFLLIAIFYIKYPLASDVSISHNDYIRISVVSRLDFIEFSFRILKQILEYFKHSTQQKNFPLNEKTTGIDCGCVKYGDFINAVVPPTGDLSHDKKYQISITKKNKNSYLSVISLKDNSSRFSEKLIINPNVYGFGPQSKYFFLAKTNDTEPSILVWNLEKRKKIFSKSSLSNSANWGFSPDGRTFLLSEKGSDGSLVITLFNLDTNKTRKYHFRQYYSGSWQFSQCGDTFVTFITPRFDSEIIISVYRTVDFKKINSISFHGDYSGLATNENAHFLKRKYSESLLLANNVASKSCN